MIPAFLVYGLVLLTAFALWRSRRRLELAILGVPIIFCGYFLISIGLFSFGENMPFTFYSPDQKDAYGFVSVMVCLHFLMVIAAFMIVGRFDRRPYEPNQLQQLKSFGLGTGGALFCLLPVVFVVLAVPTSELWFRNSFRFESDASSWLRFADLLVFVSAVLIPFIRNPILKYVILGIVTIAFLALGSRTGIAVLFVFSAMNLFVLQKTKTWVSIALFLAGLWSLGTILFLRAANLGGITAVMEAAFFGDFASISERVLYGFNYNFNLSFVLIAELLESVRTEAVWFYYGILPLPSAFFDQTEQYDAFNRFRTNIPYSGLGYTISYLGPVTYLAFAFLSSLAFLITRKFISVKRDIYEAILCFSVFCFPFIILLQYNLRTGTRIAYAFLLVYFLVALWRRGVFASRRRHISPARA